MTITKIYLVLTTLCQALFCPMVTSLTLTTDLWSKHCLKRVTYHIKWGMARLHSWLKVSQLVIAESEFKFCLISKAASRYKVHIEILGKSKYYLFCWNTFLQWIRHNGDYGTQVITACWETQIYCHVEKTNQYMSVGSKRMIRQGHDYLIA